MSYSIQRWGKGDMLLFLQSNYISGALEHSILKPYILSMIFFFFDTIPSTCCSRFQRQHRQWRIKQQLTIYKNSDNFSQTGQNDHYRRGEGTAWIDDHLSFSLMFSIRHSHYLLVASGTFHSRRKVGFSVVKRRSKKAPHSNKFKIFYSIHLGFWFIRYCGSITSHIHI